MKIGEDLVCFSYTFLSFIALFYNLRHHSIVTVQCEKSKTFCLRDEDDVSGFRYTFTAKDLEFRCNTEVVSVWIRVLLILSVLYELVVYGGAVYVYHYQLKTNDVDLGEIFRRCVYIVAGISGLLVAILLLLPLTSYILPSGGAEGWGIIAEVWASPLRGLVLLILKMITEPLRWIFYNKFKTELDLDTLHTNFSCVEPNMENALLKCPKELPVLANMPDLSYCENEFYCARDCQVVFPRIVINSLAFIFASLALFHRLLKLTHYIAEREIALIASTEVSSSADIAKDSHSDDPRTLGALDDFSGGEMKQKSVGRCTKAGGLKKSEKDVYPRRFATRKREEIQENTQQPKAISQSSDGAKARQRTAADQRTDPKDVQAKNPVNPNRTTDATTKNLQLLELETNLNLSNAITPQSSSKRFASEEAKLGPEQSTLLNGRMESEYKEQNSLSKKLTASKASARTKQQSVCEDSVNARRNGQSLMNGDDSLERRTQSKAKKLQGKSTRTSMTNGHLRKDGMIYRRTTKVEVKMGSTGDTEESEEWSSEDIVEGIEGLLVEDESEFYMSGFRL
jgi:hypothetical protein